MLGNYDSQPGVFSSIINGSAFDQYNTTAVQLSHGEDMPDLTSRVRKALDHLPSMSAIRVH